MTQTNPTPTDEAPEDVIPETLEGVCYVVARNYVLAKVESKHGLTWGKCQGTPALEAEFRRLKHKIARQAFLEIRSKSGPTFANYVARTICAQPQRLGEARYAIFSKALIERTTETHTLMMLALSANS